MTPPGSRGPAAATHRRAVGRAGPPRRPPSGGPTDAGRASPRRRPPSPPNPRATSRHARLRLACLLVVLILAFSALGVKLALVQAVGSDRYTAFAESQLVHTIDRPANRGSIFDRNERELALTVQQKTIWANPRLVTDPAGQADALAPILGLDAALLRDRLSRDAGFVYLARKVSDPVAAQVKALRQAGVFSYDEPKRFNPSGSLAAPILGDVGLDNNGLGGLEQQFESVLVGKPGQLVVERDRKGNKITGGVRKDVPSERGDDLVLTIDRSLQFEAERALGAQIVATGAKGGMTLIMETATGEILAAANLVASPQAGGPPQPAPSNTAVTDVFEPGSTNKLITITAALEEKLIQPTEVMAVPGQIQVADHLFKEHDPLPAQQSITDIMANSSNVGTIKIGQKLGKDKLDHYLRAFGFGAKTGLDFPGESRGIMLDPAKWSGTSLPTISIGQGVSVTGLQMLAAYNTMANGGQYVAPKLVHATVDSAGQKHLTPPSVRRRVISPETTAAVNTMLTEVVKQGTGKAATIDGYTVAGKTGTARKPIEGGRGYEAGAYFASFAGFVPAEKPAITIIAVLDEPGTSIYGGTSAAPVFAEVARYALRHLRIPPPPQPSVGVMAGGAGGTQWAGGTPPGPRAATVTAPSPTAGRPPSTTP